jgi:hypothetical protein
VCVKHVSRIVNMDRTLMTLQQSKSLVVLSTFFECLFLINNELHMLLLSVFYVVLNMIDCC